MWDMDRLIYSLKRYIRDSSEELGGLNSFQLFLLED